MEGTESHTAFRLLSRAHSPETSSRIFLDKIVRKPLLLRPSSPAASVKDARDRRQRDREKRREVRRHSTKPRPLSAKQKRAQCIYEIPEDERKYELYAPLREMWWSYMREILGLERGGSSCVKPLVVGPVLTSAEYVGAEVEVVRSRCVSRVGLKGIVIKDSKFTFELITKTNQIKTVPKEHTIFQFQIPSITEESQTAHATESLPRVVFELHGEQFKHRPADRANKKFKQHSMDYL